LVDPILGPSGQPLPPSNPLLSQQPGNLSATATVSTGSAQRAFAELQKVLDNIMKSFSGNWEKASNDSLKAQERFYRYVGDKDNERRAALKRYSNEAIAAIDEETKAKLEALDFELQAKKKTHEEGEREKTKITTEASRLRSNIERDALRKEVDSKKILNRIGGGISSVGSQIGGPIGGLVSGVGNFLTNPAELIPAAIAGSIIEMMNTRAAFTATGARLAGAGFGVGAGAGAGLDFTTGLFGGPISPFGRSLSQSQQRDIISNMAGSRTMIDQARAAGGMDVLRGNLGLFANILPDASKEMELFTDATKTLGMSQKDISGTFMSSRVNAERLKITQLDAISTQIEMQRALRNITNDGTVAASVLFNVGGFLKGIGTSEAERQRITLGIAQAGANLSLPQIAGMLAFTRGMSPTGQGMERAIFGTNGAGGMLGNKGTGVFGLMGEFFNKVGGQAKDPMQRLFIADAMNRQFGLGLRTQDIPQFFNLSERLRTGGMNEREYSKQVESLTKQAKAITIEGMDKLVNVVNPITQLENVFTNFWTKMDQLLSKYFGDATHPKNYLHNAPRKSTDRKPTAGHGFDVYKGF